ncbi:MAG TPA: ankyrin repeat domain-containing protein [Tepidisphaeraceae bacterium]|jgi:ankyrin repeat protein
MSHDLVAQFQREQLHRAAAEGEIERVDELLRLGYPVNRFDDLGNTPLHYAVERGHIAVVDRLIAAGADVNAHDERVIGNTPLSRSVGECSYEIAQRLIEAGADPTIPGWMQLTALDRVRKRTDADAPRIRRLLQHAAARSQR